MRFLRGSQRVAKFREAASAANDVDVYLAVVRMPQHQTDVLLTQSVPRRISSESSSAQTAEAPLDEARAGADFGTLLGTLQLNDKSLFA